MQILTARNNKQWQGIQPEPAKEDKSESAEGIHKKNQVIKDEVYRVLSDCFRCNNLIILTGLGTSLYVNVKEGTSTREAIEGKRIAPTMWTLWEKAATKAGKRFDDVKKIAGYLDIGNENIELLLSKCKIASDFLSNSRNKELIRKFVSDTEEIIREEIDFLQPDNEVPYHGEFLRRIARRSNRKSRAKIFTTNYDLCFEYAARQGRYIVIDGFSHTDPAVFDASHFSYDIVRREPGTESLIPVENVFHLYKLHGSIDWTRSKSGEVEKGKKNKPLLIYPRHTKYELAFEQPYFEMMAALQAALREPQTGVLIVGFGFNDNHISEPIWSAIRSNQNMNVVICDPALKSDKNTVETNEYLKKIATLITNGDERLGLISAKFEELIAMIPDITAETELERHMLRLRNMQGRGDE